MSGGNEDALDLLLRYHAGVIGAANLTTMALHALVRAVRSVHVSSTEELRERLDQAIGRIRLTRPRLIALIDLLLAFRQELDPHLASEDVETVREWAVELLEQKIALYEEKRDAVTRQGLEHVSPGDTILVHSASSVVTNILVEATRSLGPTFHVLVLQLDPVRTPDVARALEAAAIPHLVVPMHDLCHYQHEVDKLFIGALTITPDHKMVAPVGTAAVVSICHLAGIRSYLFANTLHYSVGPASSQEIHTERQRVAGPVAPYDVTTHSHDVVDLELIDVIVNEHGVTPLGSIGTRRALEPHQAE